jgi:hypothetical protein
MTHFTKGVQCMTYCPIDVDFGEMNSLCEELAVKASLDGPKQDRPRRLLETWCNAECQDDSFDAGRCQFAFPHPCVTYQKFTSLNDLLGRIEEVDGNLVIKRIRSVDALEAHWARRPGHYTNRRKD